MFSNQLIHHKTDDAEYAVNWWEVRWGSGYLAPYVQAEYNITIYIPGLTDDAEWPRPIVFHLPPLPMESKMKAQTMCFCGKYKGDRYIGIKCDKCGVTLKPVEGNTSMRQVALARHCAKHLRGTIRATGKRGWEILKDGCWQRADRNLDLLPRVIELTQAYRDSFVHIDDKEAMNATACDLWRLNKTIRLMRSFLLPADQQPEATWAYGSLPLYLYKRP